MQRNTLNGLMLPLINMERSLSERPVEVSEAHYRFVWSPQKSKFRVIARV